MNIDKVESQPACFVCGKVDHFAHDCPLMERYEGFMKSNVILLGHFKGCACHIQILIILTGETIPIQLEI